MLYIVKILAICCRSLGIRALDFKAAVPLATKFFLIAGVCGTYSGKRATKLSILMCPSWSPISE